MKKILAFKKQIILLVLLVLIAGVLSGCLDQKTQNKPAEEEVSTDYTNETVGFEEIKENDNTPSEIDNSTLEELDNLVEEVSSDSSLDDELSDLTE